MQPSSSSSSFVWSSIQNHLGPRLLRKPIVVNHLTASVSHFYTTAAQNRLHPKFAARFRRPLPPIRITHTRQSKTHLLWFRFDHSIDRWRHFVNSRHHITLYSYSCSCSCSRPGSILWFFRSILWLRFNSRTRLPSARLNCVRSANSIQVFTCLSAFIRSIYNTSFIVHRSSFVIIVNTIVALNSFPSFIHSHECAWSDSSATQVLNWLIESRQSIAGHKMALDSIVRSIRPVRIQDQPFT